MPGNRSTCRPLPVVVGCCPTRSKNHASFCLPFSGGEADALMFRCRVDYKGMFIIETTLESTAPRFGALSLPRILSTTPELVVRRMSDGQFSGPMSAQICLLRNTFQCHLQNLNEDYPSQDQLNDNLMYEPV